MGGADFVVDYTQGGWQKEVLKITGGRGVDVVYDPVGRIKGAVSKCGLIYRGYKGYGVIF
jgi:NADPH:quinone reductase